MPNVKYTYSVANDTANGVADLGSLKDEVSQSDIVTAISHINVTADVLDIYMKDTLSAGDETTLDNTVSAHTGDANNDAPFAVEIESETPFAAKKIKVNGQTKDLFKRVHGVSANVPANSTGNIDITLTYAHAKFTGAEIFGTDLGDEVDFKILDDNNNSYSGAPGSNYTLNQFGFDVQMPPDRYKNTSDYDADLYVNMIIRCEYTNNTNSAKDVSLNVWLHEVV